jgi:hypothetical protein
MCDMPLWDFKSGGFLRDTRQTAKSAGIGFFACLCVSPSHAGRCHGDYVGEDIPLDVLSKM